MVISVREKKLKLSPHLYGEYKHAHSIYSKYTYHIHEPRKSLKDQEEDKDFQVTDEGWDFQKHLSGPVDQKNEEKTLVSSSKALTRFSSL